MLKCYLKDRRSYIALYVTFTAVFSFISFLYGVPQNGAFYSAFLCFFILLIFFAAEYTRYYAQRKQLAALLNALDSADFSCVKPSSFTQSDMLQIIMEQKRRLSEAETKATLEKTEAEDFYALWVHQIKTPIAAMSVMLQAQGDSVRELKNELFKIEQYAGLVLSYVRLSDISSDLMFAEYSLEAIARQSLKKYAPAFIAKDISAQLSPALCVKALTDEKWLCFAIEQILSNCVKYSRCGGAVKLYLKAEKTLVIEDNGIGISAEDLPRIFEKGFTGYNGRMDKKATGIGLYLTKKALDSLGHNISVYSEEGFTRVELDLSRQRLQLE